MFTSLLLGAAFAAPGAPLPASAEPAPTGPAPWVLHFKADVQVAVYRTQKVMQSRAVNETVDGKVVQKIVQEQIERMTASYVQVDGINPKFTTVSGTSLNTESVMKRAKDGIVVLVSADGKPIAKSWLRTADPEAIVVVAEGLASEIAPRSMSTIPTAAPRLVLFGTDSKGKVQVAYNPTATGNNGRYYGGGRVVFMGNGQQMFFDDEMGYYSPNPTPTSGEAPVKPLEELTIEAYDLNGKAVPTSVALKRLAAGGYALVAGDCRIPDPAYLKQFRGDLLVLVSQELINVPTGKATKAAAGAVAPAPVPALVRPARVLIQAVPLQVVPAPALVEKVVAPAPAPAKKDAAPVPAPAKK